MSNDETDDITRTRIQLAHAGRVGHHRTIAEVIVGVPTQEFELYRSYEPANDQE